MRVAFQGVHGAYSEFAATKFFTAKCTALPLERFEDVFAAVEQRRADRGIIPIENSLAGSIHQNYDLLLAHKLYIVGEMHLRIEHALMCHSSSSLKHITQVRSHPMALAQCSSFLSRNPMLKQVPYFDTAGAAKFIADNEVRDTAAIASELATKLYGLKILKRGISNSKQNFTRFLIISRKAVKPDRKAKSKSSIVFVPHSNETGILFKILGIFYVRNIDLLKIESRPDPDSPFEYLFYLDIAGSPAQNKVAQALEHIQEKTRFFRLLGSYPVGRGKFNGGV
ncbi:MAG: prephenate dehydratase [Bacteroidetes bacterium]|nr:prephenate dehydratase [Bacteroidota bacterium]MCW5895988.1 prephenate dehydratase [Bacteroidota bacterium]